MLLPLFFDVAFALQPTLGVATVIDPIDTSVTSTASSSIPRESFRMVPELRLGVDLDSLRVLGFGTNSNAGVQNHQVSGFTRAGVLVEPVLWRSDDERVALYLIGGGGLVAMAGTSVSIDATMARSSARSRPPVPPSCSGSVAPTRSIQTSRSGSSSPSSPIWSRSTAAPTSAIRPSCR